MVLKSLLLLLLFGKKIIKQIPLKSSGQVEDFLLQSLHLYSVRQQWRKLNRNNKNAANLTSFHMYFWSENCVEK